MWESQPCHLSPMQWNGQGRDTHLPPYPLPPAAGRRRPGPGVMRTEELALPFSSSTWESRHCSSAPHLGSSGQLNLVPGTQPAGYNTGYTSGYTTCLLCDDMGKERCPCPLPPMKAGELAPRSSELFLPLIYFSTWESGPYTLWKA